MEHYGTYVDKDESAYTGWFRNDGRSTAKGILLFKNGNCFKGTWENDVPVTGTMTTYVPFYKQVWTYTGPVTASPSPPTEKGTLTTLCNGQRIALFKRSFQQGKRCGKGEERRFNDVAMASNGDSFRGTSLLVGEWRDDKFYNGRSTFSHEDSALNYAREGTFQDNEFCASKYYHPDGAVYEGSFDMNGQASGLGMLTEPGGTIECGEWKNNKRNGTFQIHAERIARFFARDDPPDYFYTSRVVQWRDNEIVEVEEADTKKRQRDFDEFETSCRKRVRA